MDDVFVKRHAVALRIEHRIVEKREGDVIARGIDDDVDRLDTVVFERNRVAFQLADVGLDLDLAVSNQIEQVRGYGRMRRS